MTPESVIHTMQRALEVTALLSGPLLLAMLVAGLIVSIFQAATQINEATLTFIPKMLVAFLVLVLAGPWMLQTIMDFTIRLYQSIPGAIG
jgi:flagellar biosynthesis protein FliQ